MSEGREDAVSLHKVSTAVALLISVSLAVAPQLLNVPISRALAAFSG